jgi:hypothetical protein
MQLAAQIRQRLPIGRVGPERAGDPLAGDCGAGGVQNQKRYQLLLPHRRRRSGGVPAHDAEAAEQLDAQP